jgi:hypothetical protein
MLRNPLLIAGVSLLLGMAGGKISTDYLSGIGRYQITSSHNVTTSLAWVVDTKTGTVQYCVAERGCFAADASPN